MDPFEYQEQRRAADAVGKWIAGKTWSESRGRSKSSWRYTCCRREFIDRLRSESFIPYRTVQRRAGTDRAISIVPIHEASSVPASDGLETQVRVRCAVERLPRRLAKLIAWRYWYGYTLTEVGKRLGVSESRAHQLHARSLRELRRLIA